MSRRLRWGNVRVPGHVVTIVVFVFALILTVLIYYNQVGESWRATWASRFLVIACLVSVLFVLADLLVTAIGIAEDPHDLFEKACELNPAARLAAATEEWREDPSRRARYVSDLSAEVEEAWWSQHRYSPLRRAGLLMGQILLLLGFFSLVSMNLSYLQEYRGFSSLSAQSGWLQHFYTSSQAMFLLGYDEVVPATGEARVFTLFEVLAGLVSVAAAIDRMVTPVDDEIERLRKALALRL